MAVGIVLVDESVVIKEVLVSCIIRRIDVYTLDSALVGDLQVAQCVEVIPFNQEVLEWRSADRQLGFHMQKHEVIVKRSVMIRFVPFPDETEFPRRIPAHQ
jgi:hypothetical protein